MQLLIMGRPSAHKDLAQVIGSPFEPQFTNKDLAQVFQVSTKSIQRMSKAFGIEPTVNRHACQRWSFRDARRLLAALQKKKVSYAARRD